MAALVSAYKDCTFSGSLEGLKPRSGSIALMPTARSMASRRPQDLRRQALDRRTIGKTTAEFTGLGFDFSIGERTNRRFNSLTCLAVQVTSNHPVVRGAENLLQHRSNDREIHGMTSSKSA